MKRTRNWTMLWLMGMLCWMALNPICAHGEPLNPAAQEAREKLSQISSEERHTLERLFALSSEIERINTQITQLNQAIAGFQRQIREKEQLLDREAVNYEKIKTALAEVLRAQQRAGAASRLEVILRAKDLKDLIHRINLLRDLSKNTSDLMAATESARAKLVQEQQSLTAMIRALDQQQQKLRATYENQKQAKRALEKSLDALKSEKEHYQDALTLINMQWQRLKPLFSETVKSFTAIINTGALPQDTVEVTGSLFHAKGRIEQGKFNAILSKRKDLPELVFGFHPDQVTLAFPADKILLTGRFELVNGQTIRYTATGGTFYGLPLSKSALLDLFSEEKMVFNLKSMIGNNSIEGIDNHDGYIELAIKVSPF